MATIRPFKGFRPTPELCSKVAALPYDVMTSKEAREMVSMTLTLFSMLIEQK